MEYFKGANDGKEFFVMNFIVSFCWLKGLGMISNQVPSI